MATDTPSYVSGLINEFNDEIYLQIQERVSKTRPYVDITTVQKEEKEITDIGGVKFKKSNSAFVTVDEVKTDVKWNIRNLKTDSYYMSYRMNNMIADMTAPGSSKLKDRIIEQIINQYQYNIDKVIYEAMDATVMAKGGTSITYASEKAGSEDFKSLADFTVNNLIAAKREITKKGFGIDENSRIAFMITDVERSILETLTANEEYRQGYGIKRNEDGDLIAFKGMDLITFASEGSEAQPCFFKTSTGTTLGTDYRKCFMFNTSSKTGTQSAITLGIRKDLIQDVYEPKDYFNVTIIKGQFHIGAIRNANSGIVDIKTPIAMK